MVKEDHCLVKEDSYLAKEDPYLVKVDSNLAKEDPYLAKEDSYLGKRRFLLAEQATYFVFNNSIAPFKAAKNSSACAFVKANEGNKRMTFGFASPVNTLN